MRRSFFLLALLLIANIARADGKDANRFNYLDEADPYYVSRTFPKLITPQWVGEKGVDAVVVLAIDDMREHKRYENYLRPILERLKKIDGRAAVSIMTNRIKPAEPHLQKWLKEGLSIEVHSWDHPCPYFKSGKFATAKETYDKCVDVMSAIPKSKPVAFRMPCCDSLNTPSPRFFWEIFNKATAKGNYLAIDTSVFQLFTAADPKLPRKTVLLPDGTSRFRRYLPKDRNFVNIIEDYPYPYVIGGLCWQFPCMVPSDWEAQHHQGKNNPVTVKDWQAALDAVVIKKGVFSMVFHPHGWIKNDQVVDFIDYADRKYGKRVKFLTFKEALEQINTNLLSGQALRDPKTGGDNGVRLLDLNKDGYLDVVIGNSKLKQTREWRPHDGNVWTTTGFPVDMTRFSHFKQTRPGNIFHFGVIEDTAVFLYRTQFAPGGWHFTPKNWITKDWGWQKVTQLFDVVEVKGKNVYTATQNGRDNGVRLRDIDGDGHCEMIVSNPKQQGIFVWEREKKDGPAFLARTGNWKILPFTMPPGAVLVDAKGRDNGVRFVDVNEDGQDDVIFSNETGYGLYLFADMKTGWRRKVIAGKAGDKNALPLIAKNGTNNGFFVRNRSLWWSNENTPLLKDHVARRSFNDLLKNIEPQAKSPQASLRCMKARPGFAVELVAAEPLVTDPIAFAWGPDGKFWVVEMGDYPLGVDGKNKFGGKVKFLEDTNKDGKYDKATVFLDKLGYPSGVMPWKKGVLVTCAPDIFYAEDTNGDGKADVKKILYTGFNKGNQQHRVNGLVWGLDNWIHCANGDSGGRIKSIMTGKSINVSGRDLRIRPWDGSMEAQSGQTQFGRSRDDWGNWFGNNNSNPMFHYALADHYLRRNPHFAPPSPKVQVSVQPGSSPVFPISRTLARFNNPNSVNRFTSACSAIVYRDELFGPAFENNTFVSEPVHNLVHREVMSPKGVTFTSRRAVDEQTSEFLASSDNWFRPTMIQIGPDGALWVADMYRHVIEHPQWIPKDWQKKLDLRAGHEMGRIYRIYPVGKKPWPIRRLDKLSTAKLVAALDSPNGWQRDMVQQMLLWKKDRASLVPLEKMAAESKRPLARLHALCTLDGLKAFRPTVLQKALRDKHPGIRRHAVRISEDVRGAALEWFEEMVDDPDPHVRMQLAYSLGEIGRPRAGIPLAAIALREGKDKYFRAAVMSSVNANNIDAMLFAVLRSSKKANSSELLQDLLRIAQRQGNQRATARLLDGIARPENNGNYARWQFSALAGLLETLEQSNSSLQGMHAKGDVKLKKTIQQLSPLFAKARATAMDPKSAVADRVVAIAMLGRGLDRHNEDIDALSALLTPKHPPLIQKTAAESLGKVKHKRVPGVLLKRWKSYVPVVRSEVLDALLSRPGGAKSIVDAIEKKAILPLEIDAARRQLLLQHRTDAVRARAAKLLTATIDPDRRKVFSRYREAIYGKGSAERGSLAFKKSCAACHRLGNVGEPVGPDLSTLSDKSKQSLLLAIVDPNQAVEAKYVGYLAVTKGGRTFSGLLADETAASITLISDEGKKQTILRTDLAELFSTGKSAMPEGLEKDISLAQMTDLLDFLRSNMPALKRKVFAGNNPELVKAGKNGSLLLSAKNCAIYGPSIVFEQKYANLGYWSSPDDRAVWQVHAPKAGKYAVTLEYACHSNVAGGAFVIEAGFGRVTSNVPSSGSWDVYKTMRVGEVNLPDGHIPVVMRSLGSIRGALIDLKGIRLTLVK